MALFCLREVWGLCVIIWKYACEFHFMREKSTLCANADIYAQIIGIMRDSRDLCVNEVPPVAPNALDQSRFI